MQSGHESRLAISAALMPMFAPFSTGVGRGQPVAEARDAVESCSWSSPVMLRNAPRRRRVSQYEDTGTVDHDSS